MELALLGLSALLALQLVRVTIRASQQQPGRNDDYVTREELNEALETASRESEYALNEWYEKFSTLHSRLSKRVKRDAAIPPPQLALAHDEPEGGASPVLRHRRVSSV